MVNQKELMQSIEELGYTPFDVQRILRADFKRRVKQAKNKAEYRKRKQEER